MVLDDLDDRLAGALGFFFWKCHIHVFIASISTHTCTLSSLIDLLHSKQETECFGVFSFCTYYISLPGFPPHPSIFHYVHENIKFMKNSFEKI